MWLGQHFVDVQHHGGRHIDLVQLFCRLNTAIAGNDLITVRDKNRIGKAKLPDTVCDLFNLYFGIYPCVAGVRPELFWWNIAEC